MRLKKQWGDAREARIRWEQEHLNPALFLGDNEYRRLWQREIDAESVYLHKVQKKTLTTSWREYEKMRREAGFEV